MLHLILTNFIQIIFPAQRTIYRPLSWYCDFSHSLKTAVSIRFGTYFGSFHFLVFLLLYESIKALGTGASRTLHYLATAHPLPLPQLGERSRTARPRSHAAAWHPHPVQHSVPPARPGVSLITALRLHPHSHAIPSSPSSPFSPPLYPYSRPDLGK